MFLEAASIALTLAMRSCGRHGFRELPARTRGACGVAWGSGADPHGWVHARLLGSQTCRRLCPQGWAAQDPPVWARRRAGRAPSYLGYLALDGRHNR